MPDYRILAKIDPTGAISGAQRVNKELDGIDSKSKGLEKTLKQVFGGVAVGAAISSLTTLTLEFSSTISEISTLVDTATFDMEGLTEAAREQAKAFASTPKEQAKALYQIISAGATSAAEATETLTAANKLAVGGVTDVKTAADGLTSVLNAYGDQVESAEAVSDSLFTAVKAGKTTIGELSANLGKVAPLAAQLGVDFDQLTGSIAALTKGGISTGEAVTGVRAILAAVAKPADEASKLAAKLGIDFSAAGLAAKGFGGFLADLKDKTGGSAEQMAVLFGGVEALVPALALTGTAGKDLENILESMGSKAGATQEAFDKMAASPGFQLGQLMANLKDAALGFGLAVADFLNPAITFLNENFELLVPLVITAATVFGVYKTAVLLTVGPMAQITSLIAFSYRNFGLLAAAQTTAAAAMGAFRVVAQAALQPLIAFNAALFANPFIAIAGSIAIVITLLAQFGDQIAIGNGHVATLADVWEVVVSDIIGLIQPLIDLAAGAWETIAQFFEDNFGPLAAFAAGVFANVNLSISGVAIFAAKVVDAVIGLFTGLFRAIVTIMGNLPQAFASIAQLAINGLITIIETGLNAVIAGVNGFLSALGVDPFAQVNLGRAELGAGKFGAKVGAAFGSGFGTEAQDYVAGVFNRADANARGNAAKSGQKAAQASSPDAAAAAAIGADDEKGGKGRKGRDSGAQTTFAEIEAGLQREVDLLKKVGIERDILSEQLRAEDQLKRKLLPTEAKIIDNLVREADALKRQEAFKKQFLDRINEEIELLGLTGIEREKRAAQLQAEEILDRKLTDAERGLLDASIANVEALRDKREVIDQIRRPMENYRRDIEALTAALAEGSITQAEFNAGVGNTSLTRDLAGLDKDLGGDFAFQAELDQVRLQEQERIAIVEQARAEDLINEQEYQDRLTAIRKKASDDAKAVEDARKSLALTSASETFDSLATISKDFFGEQSAIYKATFAISKAFAIADSIIKIQQGIANALSLPFPANILAAAGVAAQAASIVSNIRAVSLAFADGGYVRGPGTGTSDSIPANLSNGEYVVNAKATAANLSLLENINAGRKPAFMSLGGMVDASQNARTGGQQGGVQRIGQRLDPPAPSQRQSPSSAPEISVPLKVVNVLDPSLVLEAMKTEEGTQVVLNIIENNPAAVSALVGGQ